MRSSLRLAGLALAALAGAPADAQVVPPQVSTVIYPGGLPWEALEPLGPTNPFGFDDSDHPGQWPVTLSIGDLDHDGRPDYLLCMEQRLLVAFGVNLDAQGLPLSTYVIWAWFDPNGAYFKRGAGAGGADRACVHDFDGDGLAEVAAVVGTGPSSSSFRLAILGGAPSPDPAFGNLPRPEVLAEVELDTIVSGWTGLMTGATGSNFGVQAFDHDPLTEEAHETFVHDSQFGLYAIVSYQPPVGGAPGSFLEIDSRGYQGQSTHSPQPYDLDGDGLDELMFNGIVDLQSCPDPNGFSLWSIPQFANCSNQYNHADHMQPLDIDQDGQFEVIVAHDCHDFVLKGAPRLCQATVASMNQLPMAQHGQGITVGRFLPGADAFGYDGRDYLATPKGCPIWNTMNTWGSYLMNGAGDRLAANRSGVAAPNGPTGWGPINIDWDGDRETDEVFSKLGNRLSVWTLVETPAQGPTHGACPYGPTTTFPYSWTEISTFTLIIHNSLGGWTAADLYGDYREELVVCGRDGAQFATSQHSVPAVPRYLSPNLSSDYRRRRAGLPARTVDYQRMPELESVEVRPTTLGEAVGESTDYAAIGRYVGAGGDVIEVDLTSYATFTSGDPSIASFQGNVLTTHAPGLTVLNVDVGGAPVTEVPLAVVSNLRVARVVYAGYRDTFLSASQPSDLVAEARVADGNADVTSVEFAVAGGAALIGPDPVNDAGQAGDELPGDGVWTLSIPGFPVGAPHDDSITVATIEPPTQVPLGYLGQEWPTLRIGADTTAVPSGLPFPWPTEQLSAGPYPKLRGTGVWPPALASGAAGAVRVFARVDDPQVTQIGVYFDGAPAAAGMNDAGAGADDFAGDGLWTGEITIPAPMPDGKYHVELVPVAGPGRYGDAFPRLRHHG